MAYSDFTIPQLRERFGLAVAEVPGLFDPVPEADLPPGLDAWLHRYRLLAASMNTEKAKAEYLIAPVLGEFKLRHADRVSLFSGSDFTVDPALGLNGRCDFLLTRDPLQLAIAAPACVLVEAKNDNLVAGLPQCLAEMVAAQRFNERAGSSPSPVFGAVTNGIQWRFLKLDAARAEIDTTEHPIERPRKIFGILTYVVLGTP